MWCRLPCASTAKDEAAKLSGFPFQLPEIEAIADSIQDGSASVPGKGSTPTGDLIGVDGTTIEFEFHLNQTQDTDEEDPLGINKFLLKKALGSVRVARKDDKAVTPRSRKDVASEPIGSEISGQRTAPPKAAI